MKNLQTIKLNLRSLLEGSARRGSSITDKMFNDDLDINNFVISIEQYANARVLEELEQVYENTWGDFAIELLRKRIKELKEVKQP
jgi:hypothetical protein